MYVDIHLNPHGIHLNARGYPRGLSTWKSAWIFSTGYDSCGRTWRLGALLLWMGRRCFPMAALLFNKHKNCTIATQLIHIYSFFFVCSLTKYYLPYSRFVNRWCRAGASVRSASSRKSELSANLQRSPRRSIAHIHTHTHTHTHTVILISKRFTCILNTIARDRHNIYIGSLQ